MTQQVIRLYSSASVNAGALLAYPRRFEQEKQVRLLLAQTNALYFLFSYNAKPANLMLGLLVRHRTA